MTPEVPPDIRMAATAGGLLWWLNALLAHTAPPDRATEHLSGRVLLPGDSDPTSWTLALAALRQGPSLRLCLVAPGDPLGLPGPAAVTAEIVTAGVALLSDDFALVPDPPGRVDSLWRGLATAPTSSYASPLGTLSEARSLMRTAMAELTAGAATRDPDDRTLTGIAALRRFEVPSPPPGVDPVAAQVADTALRVWWLTTLVVEQAERGGESPPDGLGELRPLARRAASVAFSEPVG
ncbi:MAG: hypothetical protein U0R64_07655 [Candidatus Nanopelagicales bacterium]